MRLQQVGAVKIHVHYLPRCICTTWFRCGATLWTGLVATIWVTVTTDQRNAHLRLIVGFTGSSPHLILKFIYNFSNNLPYHYQFGLPLILFCATKKSIIRSTLSDSVAITPWIYGTRVLTAHSCASFSIHFGMRQNCWWIGCFLN